MTVISFKANGHNLTRKFVNNVQKLIKNDWVKRVFEFGMKIEWTCYSSSKFEKYNGLFYSFTYKKLLTKLLLKCQFENDPRPLTVY